MLNAETLKVRIEMRETGIKTTKSKRNSQERVFIVTESYAGIKNLSDIFADLLYAEYCKRELEITGNENNHNGYLPHQTGQRQYGDGAY